MGGAENASVVLSYRGQQLVVELDGCRTLGDLARRTSAALGASWAPQSVKFLPKGSTGVVLRPLEADELKTLTDTGIKPGSRLLVLASDAAEVASVVSARELACLMPFEVEEARVASRRSRGASRIKGRHYFGGFKVLEGPGLSPAPSQALALLHRLACDPGISGVMAARGWRVGLLSEMPPEGRVGVSEVCVLGYNVNQGQEISLRLRTDDMAGFRKYLRIRETLVHELAHNEVSPHNIEFKTLNSQLLQEVAQHEAAATAPGRVLGDAATRWRQIMEEQDEGGDEDEEHGQQAHVGVRLGGSLPPTLGGDPAAARRAAGLAAVLRIQQLGEAQTAHQQQQQQQEQTTGNAGVAAGAAWPSPAGADGRSTITPARGDAVTADAVDGLDGLAVAGVSGGVDGDSLTRVQDEGHRDPATEDKEREMARLGSMDEDGDSDAVGASSAAAADDNKEGSNNGGGGSGTGTGGMRLQQQNSKPCVDATQLPLHHAVQEQDQEMHDTQQQQPQQQQRRQAQQQQQRQQQQEADVGALDSPAARKLSQARATIQALHLEVAAAGELQEAMAASLDALSRALHNVMAHPGEPKYQRLRMSNAAVARGLGRWQAARQLLQLAGFEEEVEDREAGIGGSRALVWRRRDPGLAWLVLSVVRDTMSAGL